MGASPSVAAHSGPPNMLSMAISMTDSLDFLHLPPGLGPVITEAIGKSGCWPRGVQLVDSTQASTWKIKFKGNPWTADYTDFIPSRKLLLCAMEVLSSFGWSPLVSSDLARLGRQGASVFFVPRVGFEEAKGQADMDTLVCLALHRSDYIVIVPGQKIDAPERANLTGCVQEAIQRVWNLGIQSETAEFGCKKFKLKGNPWHANGEETVHSRMLVMAVLQAMNSRGYELLAGVDATVCEHGDVSSLIFRRQATPWLRPHIALSLNMNDRIRLITNNEQETAALKPVVTRAIIKGWPKGIQGQRKYDASHEWQMNGNPWFCDGVDTVSARRLVLHIFEELEAAGWHVSGSLDLSRKITDKSTFFFEPTRSEAPPSFVACIGLHSSDIMRLVNCPHDLVAAVTDAVAVGWAQGVQEVKEYGGAHQIKFKGSPWSAWAPDQSHTRHLMCHVLAAVLKCGWTVVSSADISAKTSGGEHPHKLDVDSWFLQRSPTGSSYPPSAIVGGMFSVPPSAPCVAPSESYASPSNIGYPPANEYNPGYAGQGYMPPGFVAPPSGSNLDAQPAVILAPSAVPYGPAPSILGYGLPVGYPQNAGFNPAYQAPNVTYHAIPPPTSADSQQVSAPSSSPAPPAYDASEADVYSPEKNLGYVA